MRGECRYHRVEHLRVAGALVVRLAQREPAGGESTHAAASMAAANSLAESCQVGSAAAAVRAAAAMRSRSVLLEMRRRNALANAVTSSGATRMPASAGTVSAVAPPVVPITGKPCASASA